jgi:hypothetical protein
MLHVAGDQLVSVGDVSIRIKEPQYPELVPIKYSEYMLCNGIENTCAVTHFETFIVPH